MDVDFVYFDVDDTLLDHRRAERQALADLRDLYPVIFGTLSVAELQQQYHSINEPLWQQYAAGEIDKATLKAERIEQLLEAVGAPHANSELIERAYMQRYAAHWTFVSGARETYQAVSRQLPVGILTNGFAEVQSKKLDAFPVLRDEADAVVVCEEVGVLKPDPEVFVHATAEAGVPPEDVLYVGDSWRSDVQGAQEVGWRVAWFARNGTDGRSTDGRGFVFNEWATLRTRLL